MGDQFVLTSPIGPLGIEVDNAGLRLIDFRPTVPQTGARPPDGLLRETVDQLEAYFAGELTSFTLPLSLHGTGFQQRVWAALTEIPYGQTRSYGAIATQLGQGTSPRAVGTANGRNPIPIIVPCHRVVGANGTLVGYGGGLDIKRKLLELEARVLIEHGLLLDEA